MMKEEMKKLLMPKHCTITEDTRHALTMRILDDQQKLVDELIRRGVDKKTAKDYVSGPMIELK